MNKRIIKKFFVLLSICLFTIPNYAMAINNNDYKTWTNSYEKEVLPTKEWKIKFNKEIENISQIENKVFITEKNSDTKIPVSLNFLKNESTVIVKHNSPFEYGKEYCLYINDSINSKEYNLKLKNKIKVPFKIKNIENIDNINGNIQNGGKCVENENWIYYSGADYNGLYKIKTDNTGKTKLFNGKVHYINTVKDWIYFVYGDKLTEIHYGIKPCIYKMKTDGSNKIKLCQCGDDSNLIVRNGWIYFLDPVKGSESIFDNAIYKIKVDGTSKTFITKGNITKMNIVDDYIYYNDNGIYKIKIDGSNKTKLSNIKPTFMIVKDKNIYYQIETKLNSEYEICKMNLDGKNIKKICEFKSFMAELFDANFFNIDKEWIYYVCLNNSNLNLCKIRIDGTGFTKLTDEGCDFINLTKDWLYCKSVRYAEDDESDYYGPTFKIKNYRIKKDGTKKQLIESCIIED